MALERRSNGILVSLAGIIIVMIGPIETREKAPLHHLCISDDIVTLSHRAAVVNYNAS